MCASCGGKLGLSFGKSLLVALPVPLALAAGFLVPSGEDKLLLWALGTAATFLLYYRWVPLPKAATNQATVFATQSDSRG